MPITKSYNESFVFEPVERSYQDGKVFYDNETKSLSFYNDIGSLTHNLGYEHLVRVVNNTGSTITDGNAVYISGIDGDGVPEISLAKADNALTSVSIGITTTSMGDGEYGVVTQFGIVNDIDTSSFSVFDKIHVSETVAGGLQTTEPLINSEIGIVLVSHATTGKIFVYNRPVSLTKKSVFFLADYDANFLNYRAKSVSGSGTQRFTFSIPSDFVSLSGIHLVGSISTGAAGSGRSIDLSSSYGKPGDADAQHSETNTAITYNFTGLANKKTSIDISSVFSSLEATDICGLRIDHNAIGGTINYYGIHLEYIGYN